MPESILFLTGHLARPRLEAVLSGMNAGFDWKVLDIGVKVAALMTEDIIARRLPKPVEAAKILLPGRCRADLDRLSQSFGVPFLRGPDELKDIPIFFGRARKAADMTKYDIQIFAEIVDASALAVEAILKRAADYVQKGANVIDLGCLPDTPFPHLEETVGALKEKGYKVSVDSANADELLRGGKAGADFLLSLNEATLRLADQVESIPVLIPKEHGDLASLYRAMDALDAKKRKYLVDPVLDPINFGFTQSLERYAEVRRERPKAEMLMGTGNLTELTDADTTGITAILLGIASELRIKNVLVVQVSPHTRRTVEEHDLARRIMYASRTEHELPKDYADGLLALHSRRPFPQTPEEIEAAAREVHDKNFRIEIAEDGIHVYNREGHHVAKEAFAHYDELARAEIAWRLGKRYAQDEPLDWGVAADAPADDKTRLKAAGHTLVAKKKREAS
jgi:hypothetical protein